MVAIRKALMEKATGRVVNIIMHDPAAAWACPEDCELQDALDASPGDTWDGAQYVKAPRQLSRLQKARAAYKAATTDAERLQVLARYLAIMEAS